MRGSLDVLARSEGRKVMDMINDGDEGKNMGRSE